MDSVCTRWRMVAVSWPPGDVKSYSLETSSKSFRGSRAGWDCTCSCVRHVRSKREDQLAMGRSRQVHVAIPVLVVALVMLSWPRSARAIGGMGFGWGWGMGQVPSPSDYINQHALVRAGRPQNLPSRTPYANNPNSYINNLRDNGLVSHVDVRRREAPAYRPVRTGSTGNDRSASSPTLPIASFFDPSNRLAWPSESPTGGDLLAKRDLSDQASLIVLNETRVNGIALISSATTAREKLLAYGRPALRDVRAAPPRRSPTRSTTSCSRCTTRWPWRRRGRSVSSLERELLALTAAPARRVRGYSPPFPGRGPEQSSLPCSCARGRSARPYRRARRRRLPGSR